MRAEISPLAFDGERTTARLTSLTTSLYITGVRHFVDALNYCCLDEHSDRQKSPLEELERNEELYQMYSRRNFLKTSATVAAASLLPVLPLRASIATLAGGVDQPDNTAHARRLSDGWEYFSGLTRRSVGGLAQRRGCRLAAGRDAALLQRLRRLRSGCSRTIAATAGTARMLPIANPYPKRPNAAALRGSRTDYRRLRRRNLVGKHTGGYDEFVFDITDASCKGVRHKLRSTDRRIRRRKPTAFRSRCSATTPAISTACPRTSATSASTAECIVT